MVWHAMRMPDEIITNYLLPWVPKHGKRSRLVRTGSPVPLRPRGCSSLSLCKLQNDTQHKGGSHTSKQGASKRRWPLQRLEGHLSEWKKVSCATTARKITSHWYCNTQYPEHNFLQSSRTKGHYNRSRLTLKATASGLSFQQLLGRELTPRKYAISKEVHPHDMPA